MIINNCRDRHPDKLALLVRFNDNNIIMSIARFIRLQFTTDLNGKLSLDCPAGRIPTQRYCSIEIKNKTVLTRPNFCIRTINTMFLSHGILFIFPYDYMYINLLMVIVLKPYIYPLMVFMLYVIKKVLSKVVNITVHVIKSMIYFTFVIISRRVFVHKNACMGSGRDVPTIDT